MKSQSRRQQNTEACFPYQNERLSFSLKTIFEPMEKISPTYNHLLPKTFGSFHLPLLLKKGLRMEI